MPSGFQAPSERTYCSLYFRTFGLAVTPDGCKVYVANGASGNVSVIATATNTVTAAITVGTGPVALGVFIRSRLAEAQEPSNCRR